MRQSGQPPHDSRPCRVHSPKGRAIGADERLPATLVAFALREISGYADRLASSGLFDLPLTVAENSDSQTRLLALTGRDNSRDVTAR